MWSESSSNGFTVDESDPVIVRPLTHVPIGSIVQSTSILKTVMKFSWSIEDEESFIERQYMSIIPHTGEDFNMTVEVCLDIDDLLSCTNLHNYEKHLNIYIKLL